MATMDIQWKGKQYILCGTFETGGLVSTSQRLCEGERPVGFMDVDGRIYAAGEIIGDKKDCQLLSRVREKKQAIEKIQELEKQLPEQDFTLLRKVIEEK